VNAVNILKKTIGEQRTEQDLILVLCTLQYKITLTSMKNSWLFEIEKPSYN